MDGSTGVSPELQLPPASAGETPAEKAPSGQAPEASPGAAEVRTQPGPAAPAPMVDPGQFAAPAEPVDSAATQASLSDTQIIQATADDADVIEKEWVQKAKSIVSRTAGDPKVQSDELSKFKAGYVQQRFNKEIKQTSEA